MLKKKIFDQVSVRMHVCVSTHHAVCSKLLAEVAFETDNKCDFIKNCISKLQIIDR